MKFELSKDKKGQWFFRIRADNGKILCHSESYSSKRNAEYGANLIREEFYYAPSLDYRLK